MLEKNENFLYFDAHFHLADCLELERESRVKPGNDTIDDLSLSGLTRQSLSNNNWSGCSCSHSIEEWEVVQTALHSAVPELVEGSHSKIRLSYGLHPQSAGWIDVKQCTTFLEQLLQQNQLHAIGEAGFDYFSQEFRDHSALQEEMFNIQLELALQYNLPLVVHCRKANEKLFEYSKQLKKLPAVLFHSFMGMPNEAKSLIARGINGYFSFGKQVLNNNKKVIVCVKELPLDVLLAETDAPFQFLKGEQFTTLTDIKRVYDAFAGLRSEDAETINKALCSNFNNLFSPKQ